MRSGGAHPLAAPEVSAARCCGSAVPRGPAVVKTGGACCSDRPMPVPRRRAHGAHVGQRAPLHEQELPIAGAGCVFDPERRPMHPSRPGASEALPRERAVKQCPDRPVGANYTRRGESSR